jgi:hypothetical protein
LFHNGMVMGGVIFNNTFGNSLRFEDNGETIKINPRLLLEDIRSDFEEYILELRGGSDTNLVDGPKTLRGKFDKMFTVL